MEAFDGFSRDELDTIQRFADVFCLLYGADDYTIHSGIHGIPPVDPELNALCVKLREDEACRDAFRGELTRRINYIRRAFTDNTLAVGFPHDAVREVLGLPEGTLLLTVTPKGGFTDVDSTPDQYRARWLRARVFTVDENGIYLIEFDLDVLIPPADRV